MLSAAFAVVIVACLTVLLTGGRLERVFSTTSGGGAAAPTQDDRATRELVLSRANQFLLRLNTYGPSDLDEQNTLPGYADGVRELITAKLATGFEENLTLAEQTVADAGYARTIQLYATGAESIDDDSASVLVTGEINGSYPDPEQAGRIAYEPLQFRFQISLIETEGEWLVDDFTPVGDDDPAAPSTQAPNQDPSSGPVEPGAPGASTTSAYAGIIERRQPSIRAAVTTLDSCGFPLSVDAGDTDCVAAVPALGSAAASLANSLQGAANPDSQVYVGRPAAEIEDLVAETRAAAADVARAVDLLGAGCVSVDTPACTTRRTEVSGSMTSLLNSLDAWEAVR